MGALRLLWIFKSLLTTKKLLALSGRAIRLKHVFQAVLDILPLHLHVTPKVRYVFVLVYWYCVRRALFIAYLRTIFFNARYMATAADADVRTILHKNFSIVIFLVGYRVSAVI